MSSLFQSENCQAQTQLNIIPSNLSINNIGQKQNALKYKNKHFGKIYCKNQISLSLALLDSNDIGITNVSCNLW